MANTLDLESKYSDSALDHFVAMFQGESNTEDVKEHVQLGLQMEGMEYLEELKDDLTKVFAEGHIQHFIDLSKEFGNPLTENDFRLFQ